MSLYHRLNDWIRSHEQAPRPHPFGPMCLLYAVWCWQIGHYSKARIDLPRWQRVRCTGSSAFSRTRPGDLGRISVPMRRDEKYGWRYLVLWDDGRVTHSPASLVEIAKDEGCCEKDPRTMTQQELEAIPVSAIGWPCEIPVTPPEEFVWFTHSSGERFGIFAIANRIERVPMKILVEGKQP